MINWKVRFKNKRFVLTFVAGLLVLVKQLATIFGYELHIEHLSNNVNNVIDTVFTLLTALGVAGIVNDPTTKGFSDSEQALSYKEPKQD